MDHIFIVVHGKSEREGDKESFCGCSLTYFFMLPGRRLRPRVILFSLYKHLFRSRPIKMSPSLPLPETFAIIINFFFSFLFFLFCLFIYLFIFSLFCDSQEKVKENREKDDDDDGDEARMEDGRM